jgi:hypothetical protein
MMTITPIRSPEPDTVPANGRAARRALILGGLTALTAGALVVAVPGGHKLDSWWLLLAYLVPFVLATETVAVLERAWFARWRLAELVALATFAVVFCVFVPKMFGRVIADDFAGFYALMRTLVPLLILAIVVPYRLGGGSAGAVRRVAYACLLVMLSGIEDLLFWVWRGVPVPARWDWADHMTVVLGHVASQPEALVFIGLHLSAAAAVLVWPSRTAGAR